MSAILERALTADQRRECDANDLAMGIAPPVFTQEQWDAADLSYLATQSLRAERRLQETAALERAFSDRCGWVV
jgi:hypothetical protein